MLPILYALRPYGHSAEYESRLAQAALAEFLQTLPSGTDDYFEAARRMGLYLYQQALAGTGKHYFLDKTPRYYWIIPELQRVFPRATFIILLRNPLAVLCSIINTWAKDNWFALYRYRHDLL